MTEVYWEHALRWEIKRSFVSHVEQSYKIIGKGHRKVIEKCGVLIGY